MGAACQHLCADGHEHAYNTRNTSVFLLKVAATSTCCCINKTGEGLTRMLQQARKLPSWTSEVSQNGWRDHWVTFRSPALLCLPCIF